MPGPSRRFLILPTVVALAAGAAFLLAYRPDIPVAELTASYTDAESEFRDVGAARVHFRIEGDDRPSKPTVLLLHGTGASLHTWDDWVRILAPDFRIVRLDLPGFGLTGPSATGDYSLEAYLEFIDDFSRELGLDRFHLVGNSLGGRIAWNYALRAPARVDRLVLIAASGYPADDELPPSLVIRVARMPLVNSLFVRLTPRSLVESSLREVYGNPRLLTDAVIDRYFRLARRPGNRAAFVKRALDAAEDSDGDVAGIRQPTLILWGALDRWVPLANAHGFKADIPDARLIVYPEAGHVPMEELPGPTARAAAVFLRPFL